MGYTDVENGHLKCMGIAIPWGGSATSNLNMSGGQHCGDPSCAAAYTEARMTYDHWHACDVIGRDNVECLGCSPVGYLDWNLGTGQWVERMGVAVIMRTLARLVCVGKIRMHGPIVAPE